MFEFLYHQECPNCGRTTPLLGTTLEEISRGLQVSRVVDHPIPFVCQRCKVAFLYDCVQKETGLIEPPLRIRGHENEKLWSVLAQCGDNSCGSRVEVFAIRSGDTTEQQLLAEAKAWELKSVVCENGHTLAVSSQLKVGFPL